MRVKAVRLPATERQALTVRSVLELAAKQNPQGLTTAAIAAHMNITQGALFRHFRSKEDLWAAVMEWVAGALLGAVHQATCDVKSPMEALEAMFLAHVRFLVAHPGAPRMILGELQNDRASVTRQIANVMIGQYKERLRTLIDAGKTCGEIRSEVDTESAGTLFLGAIQGMVVQSLLGSRIEQISNHAPGVFAIYRQGIERIR